MDSLTGWDVGVLIAAGYVSVVTLIRLMKACRNAVLVKLQQQVAVEQERKQVERWRAQKSEAAKRTQRN